MHAFEDDAEAIDGTDSALTTSGVGSVRFSRSNPIDLGVLELGPVDADVHTLTTTEGVAYDLHAFAVSGKSPSPSASSSPYDCGRRS